LKKLQISPQIEEIYPVQGKNGKFCTRSRYFNPDRGQIPIEEKTQIEACAVFFVQSDPIFPCFSFFFLLLTSRD